MSDLMNANLGLTIMAVIALVSFLHIRWDARR